MAAPVSAECRCPNRDDMLQRVERSARSLPPPSGPPSSFADRTPIHVGPVDGDRGQHDAQKLVQTLDNRRADELNGVIWDSGRRLGCGSGRQGSVSQSRTTDGDSHGGAQAGIQEARGESGPR